MTIRNDLTKRACNPQVDRLCAIIKRRPLCIRIETTNLCNAKCVFCAYSKTRRPKSVMPIDLFGKVVADYADMGGGAVSLTPIVGDALLDPHLCERLRILRAEPAITQVSLVTNGIAWHRYSHSEQQFILECLSRIDISIGGLDVESYRRMYRVDGFDKVRSAVDTISDIKLRHDLPLEINLEFRVDRPVESLMADPRLDAFRGKAITSIDAMNVFGNWGGMVRSGDVPPGVQVTEPVHLREQSRPAKRNPCFIYYMSPAVTSSGLVTACSCMNAEARDLIVGDIKNTHLRAIWSGEPMQRLLYPIGLGPQPRGSARTEPCEFAPSDGRCIPKSVVIALADGMGKRSEVRAQIARACPTRFSTGKNPNPFSKGLDSYPCHPEGDAPPDGSPASPGTETIPDICARCSSYQDGQTWLHNPAFAHFELSDDPWDVIRKHAPPPPGEALCSALRRLVDQGYRRIALYGAGRFAKAALAVTPAPANAFPLVAVIDDDLASQDGTVHGLPAVSTEHATTLGIDAAVIASQWYAWELWQASEPLRNAGIHVALLDAEYVAGAVHA